LKRYAKTVSNLSGYSTKDFRNDTIDHKLSLVRLLLSALQLKHVDIHEPSPCHCVRGYQPNGSNYNVNGHRLFHQFRILEHGMAVKRNSI